MNDRRDESGLSSGDNPPQWVLYEQAKLPQISNELSADDARSEEREIDAAFSVLARFSQDMESGQQPPEQALLNVVHAVESLRSPGKQRLGVALQGALARSAFVIDQSDLHRSVLELLGEQDRFLGVITAYELASDGTPERRKNALVFLARHEPELARWPLEDETRHARNPLAAVALSLLADIDPQAALNRSSFLESQLFHGPQIEQQQAEKLLAATSDIRRRARGGQPLCEQGDSAAAAMRRGEIRKGAEHLSQIMRGSDLRQRLAGLTSILEGDSFGPIRLPIAALAVLDHDSTIAQAGGEFLLRNLPADYVTELLDRVLVARRQNP